MERFPGSRILKGALVALAILVLLPLSFKFVENVDADEIMVVQSPASGKLTWHTTPGVKWQGFGTITVYQKRSQYGFWAPKSNDDKDNSIKVGFNDQGTGRVSGSIDWQMPISEDKLTALHTTYGSQEAIENELIRPIMEKTIYMTGPLMSSRESAAERKNELLNYIFDQLNSGVYRTVTRETKQPDPLTGVEKTVTIVDIVQKNGRPEREDESPLESFGIKTFNLAVKDVNYDDRVQAQIHAQQEAIMRVQTAMANAKKAEQDAITAAEQGKAEAAKAKWEQEVIKAKAVTEAQQQLEVARLDAASAEQQKRAQILRGEGEAVARKLVMTADGALDKKLEAYKYVNEKYAAALAAYQGNLVPTVVTGSSAGKTGNAVDFMDLLTVKTAKDLAIDMETGGRRTTGGGQ